MNNVAENALCESVILRKLIVTLRNDRGMFIHETLLSPVAPWSQQGHNPYEELQWIVRENKMISRNHAVSAVDSSDKHTPYL